MDEKNNPALCPGSAPASMIYDSALYTPPHAELHEALHAEVKSCIHATYMRSMCYLFLVYI